jgi:hypothetical protein
VASIEREDYLGVGVGLEHVTGRLALIAQDLEVIDLSVESDGVAGTRIDHRLMTGSAEIDDAQTAMAQCANSVRRRPKTAVIGPAMGDSRDHRVDCLPVCTGDPVQLAGYAAHCIASRRVWYAHISGTPFDANT